MFARNQATDWSVLPKTEGVRGRAWGAREVWEEEGGRLAAQGQAQELPAPTQLGMTRELFIQTSPQTN